MMTINEDFVASVEEAFPEKDTNLLMVRSVIMISASVSASLRTDWSTIRRMIAGHCILRLHLCSQETILHY